MYCPRCDRSRPQRVRRIRPATTRAEQSLRPAGRRGLRRRQGRHRHQDHRRGHRHRDPSQDRKTASGSSHPALSPAQAHPRGRSISSYSDSSSKSVFRANAAQQVNLAPAARCVVARMLPESRRPMFTQRYTAFPRLAVFLLEYRRFERYLRLSRHQALSNAELSSSQSIT
jgi:hypothetical protein